LAFLDARGSLTECSQSGVDSDPDGRISRTALCEILSLRSTTIVANTGPTKSRIEPGLFVNRNPTAR